MFLLILIISDCKSQAITHSVRFNEGDTIVFNEKENWMDSLAIYFPEILKNYPNLNLELGCNSDSYECATNDTMLSYNRGVAVKNYLVSHGINSNRISIKSYGGTQPVCLEIRNGIEDIQCRQFDRRVDFKLTGSAK